MSTTPSPAPATPAPQVPPAAARPPLPWRVPHPKKGVAATPSCNPNYRPPAPGK